MLSHPGGTHSITQGVCVVNHPGGMHSITQGYVLDESKHMCYFSAIDQKLAWDGFVSVARAADLCACQASLELRLS